MSLTNPFLFYVQACLLSTLLPQGSLALGLSTVPQASLMRAPLIPAFVVSPSHHGTRACTSADRARISSVILWKCPSSPALEDVALIENPASIQPHLARPSTATATSIATKAAHGVAYASGHGDSLAAMSLTNPFLFYVQVRYQYSIHSRRSNNLWLLELPCPRSSRFFCSLCSLYYWLCTHAMLVLHSADTLKLLLLRSGDVEANPGPMSIDQAKQFNDMFKLLQDVNERTVKIDQGQANLIKSINELKSKQESVELKVTDIQNRLEGVECKVATFDATREELLAAEGLMQSVIKDNQRLHERLNDIEDRSRRSNIIFHGIEDSTSESWEQSKVKILDRLSTSLSLQVSDECVERAHRLGSYAVGGCRPLIVKFSSFKTKQTILQSRPKLKACGITANEDFSPATRLARQKLFDFGKLQKSVFQLRYNKLYVNNKCFMYENANDRVYEVGNDRRPGKSNSNTRSPGGDNNQPSSSLQNNVAPNLNAHAASARSALP
ncbi:uncharacterized protein LOC115316835 [Ixodes scapularis]|uniref:uncharacterized protein LOC115316835 n=1 Tax=Ixodes scapularis TaxID=6945 RepID=UPI001A9E824F|nr:uncharacterized protein LOC115316835 [Ixodes scapularis]